MRYVIIRPFHSTTVSGDTAGDFGHLDFSNNITPDTGLIYGVSAMEHFGKNVIVYDNNATKTPNRKFLENIDVEINDEFVIKSCLSTFYNDILFAKELKSKYPNNKIHFIGHIAIRLYSWIQQKCSFIDYIAKDKTEVYLYKLGYNRKDKITINDFPTINYKLFPYKEYQEKFGKNIAYLLGSEGCKNGCLYCPYKMLHKNILAFRDIDKVIDDLKAITKLGIELVQFRDPYFTYDEKRVEELCNRIIEEKIQICWYCETYVASLSADLVELMKKAGCQLIMFGIETAKTDNLKKMGRQACEHQVYIDKINMIREIGIDTMGFYIIGMDNESWDDIQNTYYLSEKLNTTFVQYSVFIDYQQTICEMLESNYKFYIPLSNSMRKSKCAIPQRDLVTLSRQFEFMYYLKRFGLKQEYELLKYNETKYKHNEKRGRLIIGEIEEAFK